MKRCIHHRPIHPNGKKLGFHESTFQELELEVRILYSSIFRVKTKSGIFLLKEKTLHHFPALKKFKHFMHQGYSSVNYDCIFYDSLKEKELYKLIKKSSLYANDLFVNNESRTITQIIKGEKPDSELVDKLIRCRGEVLTVVTTDKNRSRKLVKEAISLSYEFEDVVIVYSSQRPLIGRYIVINF